MNDGKPVAMAGTAGQTPNGGRIAWVYTPPEYRGNGYAGAITRFLTHQQLISGKKFCFLYTDMANPTSNSIYQKLGYVYVGSSQHATLS
jgi:predicted GNAT family acetyltransferase